MDNNNDILINNNDNNNNNNLLFMNTKDDLEIWLYKNIYTDCSELFNHLIQKEIISYDIIENMIPEEEMLCEEIADLENIQWFIVSEEAYNKFKQLKYYIFRFKELYFYGRTAWGQKLVMDYYYSPSAIKVILDIS